MDASFDLESWKKDFRFILEMVACRQQTAGNSMQKFDLLGPKVYAAYFPVQELRIEREQYAKALSELNEFCIKYPMLYKDFELQLAYVQVVGQENLKRWNGLAIEPKKGRRPQSAAFFIKLVEGMEWARGNGDRKEQIREFLAQIYREYNDKNLGFILPLVPANTPEDPNWFRSLLSASKKNIRAYSGSL